MKTLLIINSTLDCGKSSLAKSIAENIDNSRVIHGDDLSINIPNFTVYDEEKLLKCINLIAIDAIKSFESGVNLVIIDYVFENPEQLLAFTGNFRSEVRLKVFYLYADLETIDARIRYRNRKKLEYEHKRTREILSVQEKYIKTDKLGQVINTNLMNLDELSIFLFNKLN